MKKIMFFIFLTVSYCNILFSQNQYEVFSEKPNEKTIKGIISRNVLLSDTSFKWYTENQQTYKPISFAVEMLQKNKDSIQLIVFMGTWCDDSHYIIPKFYTLIDAAGFPEERVTLLGVDRKKTTLSHLAEALDIKNVPTIIVMKNGKETGRVVEYGKSGMFDKDLGDILASADKH
ncbi:MAG TPA: thioredoxin family protein [Chitinophagaceae bacterium]|nr:thioredoxin family protein [Chitinophagaceae bacterium]